MKKRVGFALVTAVVISAFLMTAIVGVSTVLVSQLRIQSQAGLSRKALYYAEAALQKYYQDACNKAATTDIRTALLNSPYYYSSLTSSYSSWSSDSEVVYKIAPDDTQSFTWVKAKQITGGYQFIAMGVVCNNKVSDLGYATLQDIASGTGAAGYTVLARRVVQLPASGLSIPEYSPFKYGLFAGSVITQHGSSTYKAPESLESDLLGIYAGDYLLMRNTTFSNYVDVGAHNTVIVGSAWKESPHSAQLTLSPVDLAFWQAQFQDFLSGNGVYSGTDSTHMNTNDLKVKAAIAEYLTGKPVGSGEPSGYLYTTPGEVAALWAALSSSTQPPTQPGSGPFSLSEGGISADQYAQLRNTFNTTVFYVQDSATVSGASIDEQNVYNGVLVSGGSLSCSTGVHDTISSDLLVRPVFISADDLTFNGSGVYQGSFYTSGNFTQNGSIKGLSGSIIAATGSITIDGSAGVSLINYAAGNIQLENGFHVSVTAQSGWREADLSTFSAF